MATRWSELDVIKMISANIDMSRPDVIKGIGDDCAVVSVEKNRQLIITTDMLVENIHFDLAWHPPYKLGRKCIAVNFSDIAAMGGQPDYALLSISLPGDLGETWITEWLKGVGSMLEYYNCALIGGDTVSGATLSINVTIVGSVIENTALLRNTADAGQSIFVTGSLGSAAAGLLVFKNETQKNFEEKYDFEPFKQCHLDPEPDLKIGALLAESTVVTAMQDISDGLATDLSHICSQSGISAIIDASMLPSHDSLPDISNLLGVDMVNLQIAGGEDYHLVFTVEAGKDSELLTFLALKGAGPVYRIGETMVGEGVFMRTEEGLVDITFGGFQHRACSE